MLKHFARYVRSMPTVIRKAAVMHHHSVFLDEATPKQLNTSLRAWRVLKRDYGYLRSLIEGQCVNAHGEPIPWYTYAAIEQLSKWEFGDCDVLEYGCGNSTLWWAKHARSVTSIENSKDWYQRMASKVPDTCNLLLEPVDAERPDSRQLKRYVEAVDALGLFDVIVIDGVNYPGVRRRCTERGMAHLRAGGLVIVDNADWLPLTCQMMRDAGFFELDYCGLGPLNEFSETTSLFFRKDFRIRICQGTHPGHALGGQPRNMDATA